MANNPTTWVDPSGYTAESSSQMTFWALYYAALSNPDFATALQGLSQPQMHPGGDISNIFLVVACALDTPCRERAMEYLGLGEFGPEGGAGQAGAGMPGDWRSYPPTPSVATPALPLLVALSPAIDSSLANPLRYVRPLGQQGCDADDSACWEQRWYRSHGYERGENGWRYTGDYYFSDADALATFLADIRDGRHSVGYGARFHATAGGVALALGPAGKDTRLTDTLGAAGAAMDIADFGITGAFAGIYTAEQLGSIATGPGVVAGAAVGQAEYMSIQGPLAAIDTLGLIMVASADAASGRTGLDLQRGQLSIGGDTLFSLWSIKVSNLSPVVLPGIYLGLTGDAFQLGYDFVRLSGRVPGYSLMVQWSAPK